MQSDPASSRLTKLFLLWLPLIALSGTIGFYYWFLHTYAINVPWHDDIIDLLQFVLKAQHTANGVDWMALLHEPYNDHRTGATRLLVYAVYFLENEINFRTLTFIANLGYPLLLLLFYIALRRDPYCLTLLLVAALLLFNLRFYKLTLHAQASFAYLYVYVYAFAGLFALHRVTPARFVLAVAFCAMSTFTLASGKIVWLLGFASLLHQCYVLKNRTYYYPVLWLVITVALVVVWQVGFEKLIYAENDKLQLSDKIWLHISFFLVMLGSAVSNSSTTLAAIVGVLVSVALFVQSALSIRHPDIRLLLCCWFAFFSAAATALGRAVTLPLEQILIERYGLHSLLLICCLVLFSLPRLKPYRSLLVCATVALAGMYCVSSYIRYEEPLQSLMQTRYEYFNNHEYRQIFRKPEETNAVVREAISEGVYYPPCRPLPACEAGSLSRSL